MSRKEAELRVKSLHVSESSDERLSVAQTVPDTDTTAMLISNATSSAKPLSKRKYRQATYTKTKGT